MSLMTFWLIEVFVLLVIGGAHAFSSPELSSHRGLSISGQSSPRLKSSNEDDSTTKAPSFRRLGNEPDVDGGDGGRRHKQYPQPLSRRMFASQSFGAVTATSAFAASSLLFLMPETAAAGIDLSTLQTTPIEGDASGAASRLKQLQAATPTPKKRIGWVELDSGVSYRESSAGTAGTRAIRKGVQNGYNVGAVLTVRTSPEGLLVYSTRDDNDSSELSWKVGSGDFPRGAEEGMMGMRLGSTRRIEVPSRMVLASRNTGVLPEATTQLGKERYEAAFRSGDATLLFDVRVTGIQPGDNRQGKVSATR